MSDKQGLLDDLVNACAEKDGAKISSAFADLMMGKTYERIQAAREDLGQTVFQPEPDEDE